MTSLARKMQRANPAIKRPGAILWPGVARDATRLGVALRGLLTKRKAVPQITFAVRALLAKMTRDRDPRLNVL